jgi:transcriptional antiterminator
MVYRSTQLLPTEIVMVVVVAVSFLHCIQIYLIILAAGEYLKMEYLYSFFYVPRSFIIHDLSNNTKNDAPLWNW